MKFSCTTCDNFKNGHFYHYYLHNKVHLRAKIKIKCFCFIKINNISSYHRHLQKFHEVYHKKYIVPHQKKRGTKYPDIDTGCPSESDEEIELMEIDEAEDFEEAILMAPNEKVKSISTEFIDDILKFKLEKSLENTIFCEIISKMISFFEKIKRNSDRDFIISYVSSKLKSGKSIDRYFKSLPNYVEPKPFSVAGEEVDKKYKYHYIDIKRVLKNMLSNEEVFYQLLERPSN